jgi:hypothetical protein
MMANLHSDRSRVASMPATYENCPFQAHKNLGLARCSRKTTSRLRGSSNLHCQAQRRKPPHVMIDQYLGIIRALRMSHKSRLYYQECQQS